MSASPAPLLLSLLHPHRGNTPVPRSAARNTCGSEPGVRHQTARAAGTVGAILGLTCGAFTKPKKTKTHRDLPLRGEPWRAADSCLDIWNHRGSEWKSIDRVCVWTLSLARERLGQHVCSGCLRVYRAPRTCFIHLLCALLIEKQDSTIVLPNY